MDNEGTKNLTIKEWSLDDRPREKLLHRGSKALTDAELLAIILGSGSRSETAVQLAQRILKAAGNDLNGLSKMTVNQFMQFKGVGEAKAVSIAAMAELGKRQAAQEVPLPKKITSSSDVFTMMYPLLGDIDHEEFWAIYVNQANKILHKSRLSSGGLTATVVDLRMLFKIGLEHAATGIILCHHFPFPIFL